MEIQVTRGEYNQIGAGKNGKAVNFCFEAQPEDDCKIQLINKKTGMLEMEIDVPAEYGVGNLRAAFVQGLEMENLGYVYDKNGERVLDPYCKRIYGRDRWAQTESNQLFCGLGEEIRELDYTRITEKRTRENMFLYKLNVRTFTMDSPGNRTQKGTYLGLIHKIPYLKSLGVTAIECMPVYEFDEWIRPEEKQAVVKPQWKVKKNDQFKPIEVAEEKPKINCWGYTKGQYFAPKASYAATDDPEREWYQCIETMHQNGISCIMEIYVSKGEKQELILRALRYWVVNYHVDGFHLIGFDVPIDAILKDPLLKQTLFFADYFTEEQCRENKDRLYISNDEFLYQIRKLMNHKGGVLLDALCQMRKQGENNGFVNYLAYNNGFTLADLFSYEVRHNEANGENNRDGVAENFSSNCGVEGVSRKKSVLIEREKRMRNALALLFLSQGVPMLMAGDERMNSQKGNNNAYCQDNLTGWVNWKENKAAAEQLEFIKELSRFRKDHLIIRRKMPMQRKDYKRLGTPDLSYHGEGAWLSDVTGDLSCVGCLYNGEYAKESEQIYIGLNFSDRRRKLALPEHKGYGEWRIAFSTGKENLSEDKIKNTKEKWLSLESDTIVVLVAHKDKTQEKKAVEKSAGVKK